MPEVEAPRPPSEPWLGEVVVTIHGEGLNDLSVGVQAVDGVLTLADAEALALRKLQQRADRGE